MEQAPIAVAVFDLNNTVYTKSSKDEFFKYICYKNNYKLLNVFQIGLFYALQKLRLLNKTQFKENFFNYLDGLPPERVLKYASQFWSIEWQEQFNPRLLQRIEALRQQGVQIIFSTGGLDVYVAPLFDNHLKVDAWMATETRYAKDTYTIRGKALKDQEKTRRLKEHFGNLPFTIVEAYSDSEEDFFKDTERPFIMKGEEAVPFSKSGRQAAAKAPA